MRRYASRIALALVLVIAAGAAWIQLTTPSYVDAEACIVSNPAVVAQIEAAQRPVNAGAEATIYASVTPLVYPECSTEVDR